MNHDLTQAAERTRLQTQRWLSRAVRLIGDPRALLERFVGDLSSSVPAGGGSVPPPAVGPAAGADERPPDGPKPESVVDGGRSLGHSMEAAAECQSDTTSDTTVCGAA